MSISLAVVLFIIGLALVIYFAEKLVAGVVGTATGFGISAFWISVVFIGFDPENLAVGAAGTYQHLSGIALGSIIGAAMVAIALALGITALIVPLRFAEAPRRILLIPVAAVILAGALMLDGRLSRLDGAILFAGYVVAVAYLLHLNRRGVDIKAGGEVAETLEKLGDHPHFDEDSAPSPAPAKSDSAGTAAKWGLSLSQKWQALGLMLLSLVAIIVGSELLVDSSRRLIAGLGWSDTLFGMTLLAFLISIEELARELPAAIKKRPDITYGNVLGSVLAFFLFNAGLIALVHPVDVGPQTLHFYLPLCAATVVLTSILMATRKVSRAAGALLVIIYAVFAAYGYIWQ